MPSSRHGCRNAARLISQGLDTPLGALDRLRLQWHLLQCEGCRRFSRQSRLLREATRRWRAYSERD
jgi:hypothetical protein